VTTLAFEIVGSRAEPHAAVPTIMLRVRVTETSGVAVHAVVLRGQIRIEPQRRRYQTDEEERLYELFGETTRWGDSMRPFLWTHVSATVPGFTACTEFDLPVPCTYDFEVAAAKYLHALAGGEIPLLVLFSGTVFTPRVRGFSAEPISWDLEASHRMPVAIWREVMDRYFPNSGWVRISRDTLDRLQRFKAERALPTWDQTFESLLKHAGEDGP
jgi:hypothetical protein